MHLLKTSLSSSDDTTATTGEPSNLHSRNEISVSNSKASFYGTYEPGHRFALRSFIPTSLPLRTPAPRRALSRRVLRSRYPQTKSTNPKIH